MLLDTALDEIAGFPKTTPRSRLEGFLRRVKCGQSVETALMLESVRHPEAVRIMELAEHPAFAENGQLLGELIDAAYRNYADRPLEAGVIWTGPRLDPTLKYGRTSVAVRNLVDQARERIIIAGYHITSETLEVMGLWSALDRGVAVEMLIDERDSSAVERQVFAAKGISVFAIAPASRDYAKFHPKAIVADGSRALVGSANFTHLGYASNIELGVLVEGAPANTVEALLLSYLKIASSTGWVVSK